MRVWSWLLGWSLAGVSGLGIAHAPSGCGGGCDFAAACGDLVGAPDDSAHVCNSVDIMPIVGTRGRLMC